MLNCRLDRVPVVALVMFATIKAGEVVEAQLLWNLWEAV